MTKLPRVMLIDGTDLPLWTVGRCRTAARWPVMAAEYPLLVRIAGELHDKADHELLGDYYSDAVLNRMVMEDLL